MVAAPPGLRPLRGKSLRGRGLHIKLQRALSTCPDNFTLHDEDDGSLQKEPIITCACPLFHRRSYLENVHERGKCINSPIDGDAADNRVPRINAVNGVHPDDSSGKLNVRDDYAHDAVNDNVDDNGFNGSEGKHDNKCSGPACINARKCDYAGAGNNNPNHAHAGPTFNQLLGKKEQAQVQGSPGIQADFNQIVSASSGHIRQLDMALDALFNLHSPQTTQTYLALLQACIKLKSLSQAKQIHAHITLHGVLMTSFLGDYMVMALAKCGGVDDAYELYVTLPHCTVFSCTAILTAYADCGEADEALKFYQSMQDRGIDPDSYTFVSLFKACGSIQDLELGKYLHIYACKKGYTSIPHVSNILINMYGKCGAINEAGYIFSVQSKSNIVSWTTMLSIYIEQGQPRKVLQLYVQMQEEGLILDQFAFVFALQACGMIANKKQGLVMEDNPSSTVYLEIVHAFHADASRKGYVCDIFVGTALLTAYGKCGTLSEAENMFSMLTERNLVTWNAMLSVYMDQGQDEKALHLYVELRKGSIDPEQLTYVLAFQACGNAAEKDKTGLGIGNLNKAMYLEILQALHADFCKGPNSMNMVVMTALLSSYAKCGAVDGAEGLFSTLSHRDVVSWNAMLTAYVEQGQGEKALCLFTRMQEEHVTLNEVTLISALLACCETGSLDVCKDLHFGIVCPKFDLNLQVVATLIHAYGSCATMNDAWASFDGMAEPDTASWNAFIAGYAGVGSCEATLCMFENAILAGIKACEIAFTSVLTACTHTGLIAVGLEYFESMRTNSGITPDSQHYSILVDLLARAGNFEKLENMLARDDMQSNVNTWLFLLSACHTHHNVELAKQAFSHASTLQPKQATAYVLMSNVYANAELQG